MVKEKQRLYAQRYDGRIEQICQHGIGHTIYAPKIKQKDGTLFEDWTHGCDGCCKNFKRYKRRPRLKW